MQMMCLKAGCELGVEQGTASKARTAWGGKEWRFRGTLWKKPTKPQVLMQPFQAVPEESVSEEGSSQLREHVEGTQFWMSYSAKLR